MAGTSAGWKKRRDNLIARYGEEEYQEIVRLWTSKGGKLSKGGFRGMTPARRREVSKKGREAWIKKIRDAG